MKSIHLPALIRTWCAETIFFCHGWFTDFFFFHMQFQKTQLWKRLFLWWNYILVMRFDTVFLTLETMSEEIALPHIYSFSTPFFPTVSSERERERERSCVLTVSQKEFPKLCHHHQHLFCHFWCTILSYAKGLAKDILLVSPSCTKALTPHPTPADRT